MPANTWTTPEQLVFLSERFSAYLKAKENQKKVPLKRFWALLEEEWFARWPPEKELQLPARTPTSDPWTPQQTQALGDATKLTKRRLPAWMCYQDAHRNQGGGTTSTTTGTKQKSLFHILKDSVKATRPIRAVEMYQKLYKSKIQQAGLEDGYGDLNDRAEGEPAVDAEFATQAGLGEVHVLTADELAEAELTADLLTIQRVQKNRAARMSIWRNRSIQMWADESEEVKAEVAAATQEENERRAEAADDDDKTPEQYQHAIDQIGAVYAKVHAATMEETGWYGVTLLGGPMPRRGGQISTKTICFGLTSHSNDFASSTPQFPDFKAAFQQWTKRAFPHEVRDARGIPLPGSRDAPLPPDPLDGLIAMAPPAGSDDEEDKPDTPAPAPIAWKAAPAWAKPRASVNVATVVPAPTASSASSVSVTFASADATPDFTPNDPPTILKEPVDFTSENLALPPLPMYENFDPFNINVPENFDEILAHMGLPELDSNSDAEFLLANAWDGENADYSGANGSLDDMGGASLMTDAMDAPRPAPRPIHAGAPFTADRVVGGSPGRVPQSGTVEVNGFNFPPSLDYRPSVLLQAFKKPTPTPLPASPAVGFTFGSSSSPVFASPTPEASRNASITSVVNATVTPPPTTASTAMPTTASTTMPSKTTTPSIPSSLSTTPLTAAPAPRPAFSFSHGRPPPRQTAAASLLTSIIADATAAVHAVTQPGITPPAAVPVAPPQYIQSRPMGNPPKMVPVARAAKTKKPTKPSGTGRPRGRPRKNPLPDPDLPPADQPLPPLAAIVTEPVVPAPALLSGAASRAEAARQRHHGAELRTSQAQALAREKEMVEDTEAKRAAAAAEAKRLHNPAGGADLFITGSRPKRAILAAKNPDGSDIVHTVKRTREELAAMAHAEDQHMLDGFARQKEKEKVAGTTAAKKRKAAAPAAETAAKKHKTAPAAPATKIMRARK
ncbi:hypothetical protein B0H13DRAFT_2684177 [Mycena leptocephala]|nr:hypothetical protein B0H13DRAFT_2684177 [Mycena leptocephala]